MTSLRVHDRASRDDTDDSGHSVIDAAQRQGHSVVHPIAYVRRRFRAWWQARLPLADTLTLTQRNVYILPTRPGFMLAATLLVLLVGSINYQLNLGYLLTFLLAGSAAVGMHVCHATLRGLTLNLAPPAPKFAGTPAMLAIALTNQRRSVRHGIGLAVLDAPHEDRWTWTDVPAQGSCTVQVAFRPERRGLHRVPPLTAETRFPLGTFRSGRCGGPPRRCWSIRGRSRIRRRCRPASRAPAGRRCRRCRTRGSSRACAPTAAATRSS